MATCRVEECEICYGNFDITSGTLERRPIEESVVREPKGFKVRDYGTALLLWP